MSSNPGFFHEDSLMTMGNHKRFKETAAGLRLKTHMWSSMYSVSMKLMFQTFGWADSSSGMKII